MRVEIPKDIKAKILCQYFGVDVDLSGTEWFSLELTSRNRFISAQLVGVNFHKLSVGACIKHNIETQNRGMQWLNFEAFKLILQPVSQLTDEDALEIANLDKSWNVVGMWDTKKGNRELIQLVKEHVEFHLQTETLSYRIYQFLISKGYDLPHHLLGGKTLKEAGMAICRDEYQITIQNLKERLQITK